MEIPLQDKNKRPDMVLIYGNPGTGKTTSAEKYCKMKGYKPIVLDVNNTNHTSMPIMSTNENKVIIRFKF